MDFNQIVANTITGLNKGYEQAIYDLTDISNQVSSAIKNNSKSDFDIFIRPLFEAPKGDIFRVYFDTNSEDPESETIPIATLFIPPKGYPIQLGSYRKVTDEFKAYRIIENRNEFESYFAELLSNPDSALIQAIGFGMRKKSTDDEIPF